MSERPAIPDVAPPHLLNDAVLQTAAFNVGAIADAQTDAEYTWQLKFVAALLRGLAALPLQATSKDGTDAA